MHSFGMPGAAPGLLGATATTPAFGQGTDTVLGTSGFGLGTGQSPAAPFAFGASGGAPFGAQSSGGLFGANAASTSAQSTVSAGSAAGFTFGAQSSAVPGGTGGAAPAFSAQALNTGTWVYPFFCSYLPTCTGSQPPCCLQTTLSGMYIGMQALLGVLSF